MRTRQGPYRSERFTADSSIYAKEATFATFTIANASAAAVTLTFYDDPTTGGANPIESVVVPAGASLSSAPYGDTLNGLSVKCSLWTSVQAFVRWAPR